MPQHRLVLLLASVVGVILTGVGGGCHSATETAAPTYSVGGTLTGLKGALKLQDAASGKSVALSQDGPFAFAGLPSGAAYAVQVVEAPFDQSCSVQNANGTVQNANITNLLATCQDLPMGPFKVSGTLTGQSGTVVLQNNGGESVTLSPSTHGFKFPTALPPGAAYAVSVRTAPAGQQCVVSAGSGTVGHADVTDVAVVCTAGDYRIAVELSGATGPVSVQNEHGEVLHFATDGSAAFTTAYPFNAPFSAVISAQPQDQNCTLQPQSGNLQANLTMQASCVSLVPVTVAVQGLSGSLTVAANTDTLTFAADGNQTLATLRAPGAPLQLNITQQPAGQLCKPPAASTVQASDNLLTITCANLHSLSVHYTGATGAWSVASNQGDSLALAAGNGNATFATPYAAGSAYRVSVPQQPSGQRCTANVAQGTMPDADVTLTYTCKAAYALGVSVSHLQGGSVTVGNSQGDSVNLSANGNQWFATPLTVGSAYAVAVLQQPSNQLCVVDGANGTMGNANTLLTVRCAWAAQQFFGQASSTSNSPGSAPSAQTLYSPVGNATWTGSQLFMPDSGTNRVLGFGPGMPTGNAASANVLVGQINFTGTGSSSGTTGLRTPGGLTSDANRLVVADSDNHRVLVYAMPLAGSHLAAAQVLGQLDFNGNNDACGQPNMNTPMAVSLQGNTLVVADYGNNRALVWQLDGSAGASLVLGQPDFATCNGEGSTPSRLGLTLPAGVWTNGTRLLVADSQQHRVLIWNTFPTQNRQAPDQVLGQTDWVSNAAAAGANGLDTPMGVTSDGNRIWVADSGNHRVLRWDSWPAQAGAAADFVYGQTSFSDSACNGGGSGPTAATLCTPQGVALVPGGVLVTDTANHRGVLYP